MSTNSRFIGAIGCALISALASLSTAGATTLIQNVGPTDNRNVGILIFGWQQTTAEANVTISVPLTYINVPGVPPSQVPAFLMTSIGPGSTAADQLTSTVVQVMPQLSSNITNYTVFSGLNLSAGSYYLVVNTGVSQGAGWDGYSPAQDAATLSTAPGVSYLGTFYDSGASPQFQPSDPVTPLVPSSLSFVITGSASPVPEPQCVFLVIAGLVVLILPKRKSIGTNSRTSE